MTRSFASITTQCPTATCPSPIQFVLTRPLATCMTKSRYRIAVVPFASTALSSVARRSLLGWSVFWYRSRYLRMTRTSAALYFTKSVSSNSGLSWIVFLSGQYLVLSSSQFAFLSSIYSTFLIHLTAIMWSVVSERALGLTITKSPSRAVFY